MPLKQADGKQKPEQAPPQEPGAKRSAREIEEELAFLRQKINSTALRGDYPGCIKMIDENMRALYEKERWPDMFFSILRLYQRCYPSLNKPAPFAEHIAALFKKNHIPEVFASLLTGSDTSIVWSAEYFKDLAVISEGRGDFDSALGYCDLALKLDPGSSTGYLVRGWILDDLNRGDEAAEMFEQALELNETNHSANHALAKHFASRKPAKALEYAERAIELAPGEGAYYDTKARILLRLGDREGAAGCYDLAISVSPYEPEYLYQKAELLLSDGKDVAAIAQYRKAIALDEKHISSLWRLANLYEELEPGLALTYVNTVTTLDDKNLDAVLLKAKLLDKLGEPDAAAAQYKRLLEEDPKYHEALGGYAALLVHTDPATAVERYEKAIAIAPKIAAYHMGKARAHEKLEQIPPAVKEYKITITLDHTNARAFGRLGFLLAATKPREALDYYKEASGLSPENAYYHAARAELLMNMPGGKNEAISALNSASKYDPNNAELHVRLGLLLEGTGNSASAAEHYRQATALDAANAAAFYNLARLTLPTQPDMALMHINSAVSLDETNGEYYYLKSKILGALGNNQSALEHLVEAQRLGGENAETLGELSQLSGPESPRVALFYLNRAIELSPENMDYIAMRADLLLRLGQTGKALHQFEEVLKREPKNPAALFGAGKCLALKKDAKALGLFDKALATEPENAACLAEKAKLLEALGSFDEAAEAYGKAAALNVRDWESMFARAKLLETKGQTQNAVDDYRAVLSVNPDCAPALLRLGVLLAEKSPAESADYLQRCAALAPEDYMCRAWLGRALLALNRNDEAAEAYRDALRLGGENAETYYTLAEILWKSLPETALGYCLRALAENGENAVYHLLCGKIYAALLQYGHALECFEQAAALSPEYHEAYEQIAGIRIEQGMSGAFEAAEKALASKPDCPLCLLRKAESLDSRSEPGDTDEAIACLDLALKTEPGFLAAREALVALLEKKRARLRLPIERRRLEKLKRETKTQAG